MLKTESEREEKNEKTSQKKEKKETLQALPSRGCLNSNTQNSELQIKLSEIGYK